jgi:tetratricopeptide (TPR) repeat protein
MESRRPPSKGSRPSSRPSSGRPSSRPSSSSSRPQSSSDRPRSDRPTTDRPRSDAPRGGRADRAGATRPGVRGQGSISPRTPMGRSSDPTRFRPRIVEPLIPEEVTGEELEKSARAELLSLSADNAKVVARHLVCVGLFIDSDPERAYLHGMAAAHHAGRLAVARETAGYAAYRAGKYEVALRELRAAYRISGDVSTWPVMADCERGLGRPLKALEMAGSPEVSKLEKAEEIEMRIVASGARRDLGQIDAAVITLTCRELKTENAEWSVRLRYAYADALHAAGRLAEAKEWFAKCALVDTDDVTDAAERAQ